MEWWPPRWRASPGSTGKTVYKDLAAADVQADGARHGDQHVKQIRGSKDRHRRQHAGSPAILAVRALHAGAWCCRPRLQKHFARSTRVCGARSWPSAPGYASRRHKILDRAGIRGSAGVQFHPRRASTGAGSSRRSHRRSSSRQAIRAIAVTSRRGQHRETLHDALMPQAHRSGGRRASGSPRRGTRRLSARDRRVRCRHLRRPDQSTQGRRSIALTDYA